MLKNIFLNSERKTYYLIIYNCLRQLMIQKIINTCYLDIAIKEVYLYLIYFQNFTAGNRTSLICHVIFICVRIINTSVRF